MPPPPHPTLPPLPQPRRIVFDPFNSSSTGHQRAENTLSGTPSWRDSRNYKLAHQFRDVTGAGGSRHLSDLVGAGSENFGKDGRKPNGSWEKGAPGLREGGCQDIRDLMSGPRKKRKLDEFERSEKETGKDVNREADSFDLAMVKRLEEGQNSDKTHYSAGPVRTQEDRISDSKKMTKTTPKNHAKVPVAGNSPPDHLPPPQIFRNLTFYLNGSTAPLISDHKIKHLFVSHGGNASCALGRRTVTHVILGTTCGGGLASGKFHKEITTVGGKGIKYVTAQWVLDSVEKGIRQPEARYVPKALQGRIGGRGQASVRTLFKPLEK